MAALVVEDTAPFARGGDWEPEPLAARKKATASVKPNADPATARRLVARRNHQLAPKARPPSEFRKRYQEGLLPVRVVYANSSERRVGWSVADVLALDLHYYAKLCCEALDEPGEPYGFLASEALVELLYAAGPAHRAVTLAPIIAPALKEMLRSPDAAAASRALLAVHAYATCDAKDRGGLGVCGRAWDLTALSAAVNASRRNHPGLGDRALATLRVLEAHGGPGSLGKIKKGVLDYVSKDFGSAWE